MANRITFSRIPLSLALLFCPVFSPPFYCFYLAAGLTDMVDGAAARKTNTVSDLGARLDTAADLVFAAVCLIKLLPVLDLAPWMYGWAAVIALIRAGNLVSGYVTQKKLVALHTVMNKATGVLLFVLPLTLPVIDLQYSAVVVCAAATLAAVQEGHYIRTAGAKTRAAAGKR